MTTSETSGTVVGATGGIATGYVLWLLAFSIADDNAACSLAVRGLVEVDLPAVISR
jgi:hypothetical protein